MQFGAYTVERELGAGGMSQVWLARAGAGALIVLKRQLNPADDDRLRMEGRLGMRLRHPGIVQTLDVFEHEGRPVLVLEYVPGASLAMLRKLGPLAPEAVCRIGADIADALGALHGASDEAGQPARILHRDVSPANIIVSPDGRARLIDLGIARTADSGFERTRTGDLRGTVRYLAPELFDGRLHSPKSDLWALGVCLFEAALGRPAATGPEAVLLARIVQGRLLALGAGEQLAPSVASVVARMCAPEEARIGDAVEAAWLLSQAERTAGDGRTAAAVSVYAILEEGIRSPGAAQPSRPASSPAADLGEDAFLRFAASTYCAMDDDDPFANLAATAVTPHAMAVPVVPSVGPASGEGEPVGSDMPPTALWTPESDMVRSDAAKGVRPIGGAQWTLPPPTTGAGGDTAPERPVGGDTAPERPSGGDTAPEPAARGFPSEEPTSQANAPVAPLADPLAAPLAAPPAASDPVYDELLQSSRTPWLPIAAGAVALAIAVLLLLLR